MAIFALKISKYVFWTFVKSQPNKLTELVSSVRRKFLRISNHPKLQVYIQIKCFEIGKNRSKNSKNTSFETQVLNIDILGFYPV